MSTTNHALNMEPEAAKNLQDTQSNSSSDDSNMLHSYILIGDIENVKTFLTSKTHQSQPYLNEKGQSAAFVAINRRQFNIYSLLLSHDIRFINDDERRILKELSKDERSEFNKTLDKNSKEIKDAAVSFLLSNTTYVNNESSDKIDIERCYKELSEIPEIGLMLSVVKCSGFVKIIFDFRQKTVADIEPLAGKVTFGICHPTEGKLLIGANRVHVNEIKGTIAHELTHYAMQIVFSNDCKPYHFNDNQTKFNDITSAIQKLLDSNNSDIQMDPIICRVFRYRESEWSSELIVRVNQMLAIHGKEIGEKLLNEQAGELLKFYRKNVMPHFEQFIKDNNYLLKPKTEVEIFNLSSGLITKIKESAITFINSFKIELDEFIKSENSFLLLSTPSSILSAIKLFQSANELHLNLNQYILIDFEIYFKQPNVIEDLLRSASCILFIINISKNLATENIDTSLQQLLNNLSNILETIPKFKIAFVFYETKLANILTQLSLYQTYKFKFMMDTSLGFADLTQQTRLHVLGKEIEFQGEHILLKTLTATNRQLIDAKLLTKFISNKTIRIGSSIITKNYNPDTYISRELKLANANGNQVEISEMDLIERLSSENVILIADIAGSGKSTLLTHIAVMIKKQFKDLWIVRVNLNSFTKTFKKKLKSNNQFNCVEAVEFLIKSQQLLKNNADNADFSKNFFQSNLNKVVVMFDGFDEINPDYATTVQSLIKATMDANVKQIWLTTRPQCKTMLETQFKYKSIQINPLNEEIQMQYLVTFWKKKLNIADKDDELETFARKKWNSIFYKRRKDFLENPLQLKMFAEASLDQCKEWLQSAQSTFSRPVEEQLGRVDLYEKFICKKLDVYQDEKLEVDTSKVGAKKDFPKEKLVEIHEIAALKHFFNQNEVQTLLSNCHIKQDNNFEQIEMYGIITNFTSEQPEFVHLTFAEYFVAKFISQTMSHKRITKKIAEIILEIVFLKDNFETIRSFVNEILTDITTEMVSQMQVFVLEKCSINERRNPISDALHEGNDKIIQLLCSCFNNTTFMGKIITTTTIGKYDTLLHLAAKMSNKLLIKMLIENYMFYVDIVNGDDETPLHVACQFSTQHIIKMLIDYGANVNNCSYYNRTSLHYAVYNNSTEVLKMLINDYGLNVNAVDNSGITPLLRAAKYNSTEIVKILIDDYKANANTIDHDGNTSLHWAAGNNSKEVVKMLIADYEASVNAVDSEGRIPLHCAAKFNNKEVVKMLIDNGSNVNVVNNNGRTPLFRAARFNDKKVIKMLIDCGANVNAVDDDGSTPLLCAAKYNAKEVVKMLIDDYGANLNAIDNKGRSLLHCAAKNYKHKELIQLLINKHGANVNAVDNNGSTPLHWAAMKNSNEAIKMLIDYGANVNAVNHDGSTPLHWASEINNEEVIKMLVDHGANINAVNNNGKTPLHWAVVKNREEVIQMLIDYGANVNAVDNNGNTPLHWTAEKNCNVIQMLTECGANVNAIDNNGRTPLHLAAFNNNKEVVKMLIAVNGVNVNAVDNNGNTPLHCAADKNCKVVAKMLIKCGANINAIDNNSKTPLHLAAFNNNKKVVKMLIAVNGVNVDAVSDDGGTPLHCAARKKCKNIVKMLIKCGACVNAVNNDGSTPLHWAAEFNSKEIVKVLINSGANVNATSEDGRTPLHLAAEQNSKKAVIMLMGYEANVNAVDNKGNTPLYYAALRNSKEVVKMLMDEYGATVNAIDNN